MWLTGGGLGTQPENLVTRSAERNKQRARLEELSSGSGAEWDSGVSQNEEGIPSECQGGTEWEMSQMSVGSGCWQLRQGLDLGHDETALGVVTLPDRLQQGEGYFNCQPQTNT